MVKEIPAYIKLCYLDMRFMCEYVHTYFIRVAFIDHLCFITQTQAKIHFHALLLKRAVFYLNEWYAG